MADLNYKLVGNLSHVRMPSGMQLSVAYLLIDQHPEETRAVTSVFGQEIRQVRGYNWEGNHVFTVWIKPGDELVWVPCESNMKLMTHDDKMKDIGPTGIMKLGEFECALVKSDYDQEFLVEDVPCETNDPEQFLDLLENYYKAPNIGVTVYVPLRERKRLSRRLSGLAY